MHFTLRIVFIALALLTATTRGSASGNAEDATLRSVYFVDAKEGWAVGDEGVILHTLNGGKSWHRQTSDVRASLRSVQFLTPDIGWVAGREELPNGMGSVGVVLFTSDGGLEWKRQLPNTIPGLNQVRFIDRQTGFFLGDGTDQFPSGVFKTTDAGKSWEPVPGPRTTAWLGGDYYLSKNGILVGAASRLATHRGDRTTLADQTDWLDGRDVTSVRILDKKALAVGQGGLVISSVKGGSSWGVPQKILPGDVQANLDFHAIHAVKDHVWIVGRPGSVVVASTDAGATWAMHKTGQSLPLHGVFFFDERTGWAVGDAGTILHSSDGGKTWTTQHQVGKRVAAMTIHTLNANAPVDTLSLLAGAEGYLMTSLRVTAPDANTVAWNRALDARRYAAAMRSAGGLTGETLWHFPMPQHLQGCDKKTILAHWNQLHASRAEDELIRQLVLTLRTWRPSVIVSEHPESKIALSAMLGEAVLEAVRRAADAKSFPEQITDLGLEAWTVRKVYGIDEASPQRKQGQTLTQDNDELKQRLRSSVRDHAANAYALLTDRYTQLPRRRTHELLSGGAGKAIVERHWLEGLDQKAGESRRALKLDEQDDVKLMQALFDRRAVVEMAANIDDPDRTLKMVPIALDKLPDEQAVSAAYTIAARYAESGQWFLAQEFHLYLVDRFPHHPLAADSYRWLVRLNTSSEARRRHELKHFAVGTPIGLARNGLAKQEIVQVGKVVDAKGEGVLSRTDVRDWNKGTAELSKRLGGFGPVYSFDPATQVCAQSATRRLGEIGAADAGISRLRKLMPAGPWHEAANAELWLTDRSQPTPRRLARVRQTEVRPFLDGKFDDPCWKDTKAIVLDNAVGDTTKSYPSEAMFAYDQEFLYIALRCKHPAGQRVEPVKPRPRDADLDAFDRVSILIDLDRDYSTYHHLEVDQRGCVRDSCWGDRNWNPRWFVAVHSVEDCWQIEAAIPLGELTSERITQQTAWAFNVVRVLPGRGVQSWSQPADVQPRPEGMSLLLFQTGGPKPMPMAPAP